MQVEGIGPKPRLEFHPPASLIVDERYQRSASTRAGKKLVQKIVDHFYWPFFGVIIATDNGDGTYCVIDGQHRSEAARQHPDVYAVPVMVVDEMSLAEQAKAFVMINENRVRLNALQLHHASVRSGDETAVKIDAICREEGLGLYNNVPSTTSRKPAHTMAVKALYEVLRSHGPKTLRRTIQCLLRAYPETTDDIRAKMIKAVGLIYSTAPNTDDADLVRRIQERDAIGWEDLAKQKAKAEGIASLGALVGILDPAQLSRQAA